jgi:xylulokinase
MARIPPRSPVGSDSNDRRLMGHLLGIDAGTTSLKVGVFHEDGTTLAVVSHEYTLDTPAADRVELPAERYWEGIVAATDRAIDRAAIRRTDVSAIGVSSQGETVIPVAADGTPIGPAVVWLDNRAAAEADELAADFDPVTVYAATGVPAINPTWTACKLLWWKHHQPEIFERAARFLLVEDLILHRLTGQFVTEGGIQCTSLLFDIRHHGWWQPMLDRLELSAERLPGIISPGSVVGTLGHEAAEALHLPRSVAVVAAGMDQGAGAVGVGNVEPGVISESTGGALALQATVGVPDGDQTRQTPVYVHSAPDRYFYAPVCQTGGMALTWFRDRFADAERTRAATEGRDAYDLLTELALTAPPGSNGLTMLPHLMGAFSPEYEPLARGVFFGFTLAHGKAEFVRAILEGVAYMLRRNLELLATAGASADELHSHGGGAKSDLWCQIKADVCGLPVVRLEGQDAAVRGDAMLAGVAASAFRDLEDAQRAMVKADTRFLPDPVAHAAYEQGYGRYADLFEALRPVFVANGAT